MSFSSWFWGTSQIYDAIEKATSELLPAGTEDIALNLEICDQIRSKSASPKEAMRAIKVRLNHKNPNVQLLSLGLTDVCVKNGGDHFLVEIASREFMDNLVSILKIPTINHELKGTILRLIQNWSVSFEGKPSLSYVGQVYKTLKDEGFTFPPKDLTASSSAMVDTQTAPEWIDSDVCLRCRTAFSFTNRKHHCRNCGQVFDQACSSKSMPLPHFGITQDVRVCDTCYSKLHKNREKADKGHRHSASLHGTRSRGARDLADAELQRAIQLSLQEVNGPHPRGGYVPSQPSPSAWQYSEPPLVDRSSRPNAASEEDDPDLRAAIEASLREANAPKPSAPIAMETPRTEQAPYSGPGYSQSYPPGVVPPHPAPQIPNYDLEPLESDAILTFSQTVEQVQAQGGKDISKYPAVNELYDKANSLRPKLAMSLDDAGRKEQMLTEMHDKMSEIVKLYDNVLSRQVAQPRWRSPQQRAVASPPPLQYQQAGSSYHSGGYNAVNGYSQWGPNPVSPIQQHAPVEAPPPPRPSYFPPEAQYYPQQQQEPQYSQMAQPATANGAPISQQQYSYSQHSEPQQYSAPTPVPTYAEPQHQQQYEIPSAPTPVPIQPQQLQQPVYAPPPPPPQQQQQQYASSPPVPHQSPPASLPQSPPSSTYAGLARQNTVSYGPSSSITPTPSSNLARSSTVGHAPRQLHQQQQQYSQPAQLPQFPVAPTSAPQAFDLYAPSGIPAGVERKEALLIDL